MNKLLCYVLYHLPIKNRKKYKECYKKKKTLRWASDIANYTNNLSVEDIQNHRKFMLDMKKHKWEEYPKKILFFMHCSLDMIAGGYKTHLDLIDALRKIYGAKIYICFVPEEKQNKINEFAKKFNTLYPETNPEYVSLSDINKIYVDLSICLGVLSAIESVKYNNCKEKYQHQGDYSPLFYPSGTETSIIEFIYSLGFYKITNSNGLKSLFQFHNPEDIVFRYQPGIDHSLYYPKQNKQYKKERYKIIFYGRPITPRNMFSFLVPVIKKVKNTLGDKVEFISVGEEYNPENYGLDNKITNLGRLGSLSELAKLYRDCDLGISLISTPTFSYQHLEFMASGLCLITNKQVGVNDFLQDNKNAIVVEPIVNLMAERIIEIINNPEKLEQISKEGVKTVQNLDWNKCFESIASFIYNPK